MHIYCINYITNKPHVLNICNCNSSIVDIATVVSTNCALLCLRCALCIHVYKANFENCQERMGQNDQWKKSIHNSLDLIYVRTRRVTHKAEHATYSIRGRNNRTKQTHTVMFKNILETMSLTEITSSLSLTST